MIDWDALAPDLDFVAIKASGRYDKGADTQYARNVAGAVARGVPFHAFHFVYSKTTAEAKRDAALFYRTVATQGHWPLFWVLDLERGWGVRDADAPRIAAAFEAELRRLAGEGGPGEIRVALYVAHEFYNRWALDYGHYEYIWIPRYGANTSRIEDSIRPGHPCDLWQYTSRGRLPGIRGDVDIDVLNGPKPMGFFTGKD